MQLFVRHAVEEPLTLPINYHHMMQSIIFGTLKQNGEFSKFLHDEGYSANNRMYKLFTFGPINGRYTISGKNIIFHDEIAYEIRSMDTNMINILYKEFLENGISYFNRHFANIDVKIGDEEVETDEVLIQMISPICIYSTDKENGKTIYYTPMDDEFYTRINDNFKRKYHAYALMEADSDIEISLEHLHPKDKYVTNYKGTYISAWKGSYILRGKRKYLNFLYQVGLGSKNSQGFGMFKII